MKRWFLLSIILPVLGTCQQPPKATSTSKSIAEVEDKVSIENPFATIAEIPVPDGYERVEVPQHSFALFLRNLPLKKSKTVFLYNGQPKLNQDVQFAVVNISVGKRDLQQCADAVMRLRAEYLYNEKRNEEIRFSDNANVVYRFSVNGSRSEFDQYMEKVFSYCGTLSLEKQLHKRSRMDQVNIGDVLIKGGSPGHAVLVVDLAVSTEGKKIILLSQGYMPAQDFHVVINPGNLNLSPWYIVDNEADISTPEWKFKPSQLRHW